MRQIDEALGDGARMDAWVIGMKKNMVTQKIREMPRDDYAMIDAQKMMDANDAANALQIMLGGKIGNLSLMTHNGVKVDCSVWRLARITRYWESNPDKVVVAAGHTNQLECIDCITNQHDYDEQ